ncbi:hypothetical protein [Streptomyces sp. NPDC056683]|uniref:hypothetical protein n=1 Tax=Streptomyces sp. NPDC056683 TaxID=3345910 RepID=UPI0036923E22
MTVSAPKSPTVPRIPRAPRVDRETAMSRPCEGCGAAAGEECTPLSMCEAD